MANGGRMLVTQVLREMPYREYLLTNHWQQMRERTFSIHGRRCFVCGTTFRIEVHHTPDGYTRRGEELECDLYPLCRAHHELQHEHLRLIARERGREQFGQ